MGATTTCRFIRTKRACGWRTRASPLATAWRTTTRRPSAPQRARAACGNASTSNADQADADCDGMGDMCDPCPLVPGSECGPDCSGMGKENRAYIEGIKAELNLINGTTDCPAHPYQE